MMDLFCSTTVSCNVSPRSWKRILLLELAFVVFFYGANVVGGVKANCRLFGCNIAVGFDIRTEICCGGTVFLKDFDKHGNEKTKCCYGENSTMYNVEKQECCEGKVISKDSSSKGCCQGKVFNKEINICCEGKIKNSTHHPCCGDRPVFPSSGVQCCGGEVYDSRRQTCCNGVLLEGINECCGDRALNPGMDKCCRHNGEAHIHIDSFGTRCCGLDIYQPGEQLCCNSVVNDKLDDVTECCGNTTFNIKSEVCCQEHALPREPGKKSCCGGRLYDEDDEVCCRDTVHSGGGRAKCCNEEPYQEEREVCFNDFVLNETVPQVEGVVRLVENSATAYLKTNQFECGGKLLTRSRKQNACCSNVAYNSADQLCCDGPGSLSQIVEKGPTDDRCCGLDSYNSNSHGCCTASNAKIYNLKTEICNKDGVHPRYGVIETAEPCLQNTLNKDKVCEIGDNHRIPFNSNTSVCTSRGVVALPRGLGICGNETFDKDLFMCCRGVVFTNEVKNERLKCCPNPIDQETFIPAFQTCYNGRIINIPERHASSCKGKVFDNRTYECDVIGKIRSIARIQEEPNVCWLNETYYLYFNHNTHTCCNGYVIEAIWTCCAAESECCNPGDIMGYNRQTHVCCGGVLREVSRRTPINDCRGGHCRGYGDNSLLCCHGTSYDNFNGELITCDGNLLTGRLLNNSIVCRGKLYDYGTDCCGDTSYDGEIEICCGGEVAERNASTTCCGNHFYDLMNSYSLCCESSFYENVTGLSCCGGVTYDVTTETCCTTGGKTYVFPSKDGLCCSNGEYYDDTLHTCCDGLVHKYVTNGTCCGNDVIRDPTREGCFNERIYQLEE